MYNVILSCSADWPPIISFLFIIGPVIRCLTDCCCFTNGIIRGGLCGPVNVSLQITQTHQLPYIRTDIASRYVNAIQLKLEGAQRVHISAK